MTDEICKNFVFLFTVAILCIPAIFAAQKSASDIVRLDAARWQSYGTVEDEISLGKVVKSQKANASHIFVVKNVGVTPLTINRIVTSCGCTTAVLEGVQGSTLPFTIVPGAQVSLNVSVNTDKLRPGPLDKSVLVYVNDENGPALLIKMIGTLISKPSNLHDHA